MTVYAKMPCNGFPQYIYMAFTMVPCTDINRQQMVTITHITRVMLVYHLFGGSQPFGDRQTAVRQSFCQWRLSVR